MLTLSFQFRLVFVIIVNYFQYTDWVTTSELVITRKLNPHVSRHVCLSSSKKDYNVYSLFFQEIFPIFSVAN